MTEEQLRQLLLESDPARNRELPPDRAAAMRRKATAAVRSRRPRAQWLPALAALAAMLVFIVSVLFVTRPGSFPEPPVATQTAATDTEVVTADDEGTSVRQIQYTTEGGTRVVWTLNPDFEL